MPFQTCLTILICLLLAIPGCMKAVAPTLPPSAPPVKVAAPPPIASEGPHDSGIAAEDGSRPSRTPVADPPTPPELLAVADRFAARGEVDQALDVLDRAAEGLSLQRQWSGEAMVQSRKALLLFQFGRDQQAIALIREAGKKWANPPLTAFGAYLEGHRALREGNFSDAVALLKRSLADNAASTTDPYLRMLRRDAERDAGIAAVLSEHLPALIAIYGGRGRRVAGEGAAGETHLQNALALNRELSQSGIGRLLPPADFARTEADAYNFLGLAAWMRGSPAEAFRYLSAADERSSEGQSPAVEIRNLLFQGELGLRSTEGAAGRRAAGLLLQRADDSMNSRYRVWARMVLARYQSKEGRNREAIDLLRQAALIAEAERAPLPAEMVDELCRQQRRALYETLVELLAGQGMVLEALTAAERAKSLRMVDLLAGHQALGRNQTEREWIRQEAALGGEIRELQRLLLMTSDRVVGEPFRERLKKVEASYKALRDRIGAEEPELFPLIAVRIVDPASLQRRLDENTTLFGYFATTLALHVWAVHPGRIHHERIDLPKEELRSVVFSFRTAIRDRNRRRTTAAARKAYDLLLKPVIPFVSGERLGFIPDDALTYLPFAAMNYRGKYLIEGFSIFQLPSADLFDGRIGEETAQGLRVLAFGDPVLENEKLDLQHAPQELAQIRRRIGSTTLRTGRDASEANIGEAAAGYDILHFAVRGQFFPTATLDSGLLLTPGAGQDGRLTISELFGLRFPGSAIVVSGAEPLPERDPEGNGLLAMQRALLNTGSRAVITTLWLGDERAAGNLIDQFYRELARKEPFPEALRTAQLRLLREGQPPHVWAAFVLSGGN